MSEQSPLTGQQFNNLVDAISAAFPDEEDLEVLVRFKLGKRLGAITKKGKHDWMIMNVIEWAQARGKKLDDLVVGALNQNPENPLLRAVARRLNMDEGAAAFEAYVLDSAPPDDVENWRSQMMACERAVCRVEAGKYGTGFLVGPGLVLTNYHVVDDVIADYHYPENVVLRFDYKKKANGDIVQQGTEYRLDDAEWLAASSPAHELDYALLRVKDEPEKGEVADQAGAPKRGHLTPQAASLKKGDPLFIIQHPEKSPLKFAVGHVEELGGDANHVLYKVNTAHGSSGAPCFTADWRTVALHHWGSELQQVNRGVVLSAVLADWRDKGLSKDLRYLGDS